MNVEIKSAKNIVEILVVEDSPTQAEKLKYILEEQGYRVTLARDGKQAYSCLNGYKPSLIITDINMPEMNGYELSRRIKKDEYLCNILVILLTPLSSTEDVLEGLSCGADSFITKPYSTEYMLAHVDHILGISSSQTSTPRSVSLEVPFAGKSRVITTDPQQMLGLLLSTFEAAMHRSAELNFLNGHLEDLVDERTSMLSAEISERERLQSELQILSLHDELTGLLNRRGFMLLAEYHWRLALRVRQEFALLYMDLNDFKQINDTFGHAQGDQALCDITRVLEQTFRDSDILGRLGGDEFVALLVDSDMVTAKLAITRLQESLGKVNETRSYTLSLSIGLIEFYPNSPASITDLLDQADADMYMHKQQYHKRV